VLGKLRQRGVQDDEVVGAVSRRCPAGPQVDRERFAGAVLAVVDERTHRRELEPSFEGRLGAFLVRVRSHQRGVDVDDHLASQPALRGAGQRSSLRPDRGAGPRTNLSDCRHRVLDIGGQRCEQPGHRRVGGNSSEHHRLGADSGNVGQTSPPSATADSKDQVRWDR